MVRVLILQNSPIEGAGLLGSLLRDDGFDIHTVDARHNRFPPGRFDLLVSMGAPESANDDLEYIRSEERLMREYADAGIPILGVCFGSQLLARALGARVYRGPATEIGFYDDLVPNTSDPLMAGIDPPLEVFHWHSETFDLPEGAVRLASSSSYENQAFRAGSAVGLQFHLEVGTGMIDSWLEAGARAIAKVPEASADGIRAQAADRLPKVSAAMRAFYSNFKSEFL